MHHRASTVKHINDVQKLVEACKRIGHSPTDVYTGNLTPAFISNFVFQKLQKANLLQKYAFKNRMEESKYTSCLLPDESMWILRYLPNSMHFVHVHPARKGAWRWRAKSNTIKTAIAAFALSRLHNCAISDGIIIKAREQLGLDPIHHKNNIKSVQHFIALLKAKDS